MRNVGSWTGSLSAAIFGNSLIGNFKNFTWWQIAIITMYIIIIAIVAGISFSLFQDYLEKKIKESSAKFKDKWNGKRKE